jgi:hypothetical protein
MALTLAKGYCDLNIPIDSDVAPLELIKRALNFGYETLALNIRVHQKELISKARQHKKSAAKKAKTGETTDSEPTLLDFPEPPEIKLDEADYPDLAIKGRKPVILYRLTITFTNNDFLPFVYNSKTFKKYDLLAVMAESTLAMQNLLKSAFNADIVCFDPDRVN